jgi:hypothetical protein
MISEPKEFAKEHPDKPSSCRRVRFDKYTVDNIGVKSRLVRGPKNSPGVADGRTVLDINEEGILV